MVLLHTPERDTNFTAADFTLKGTDGNTYKLKDIQGEHGTLIMFICNHCPYVIAIIDRLVATCKTLQENGINCAAIMPNDTQKYPADSFENMQIFGQERGFTFPYLIDETQQTARSYDAVCTPDFFGFDRENKLIYRGRLDSARNQAADQTTVPELYNAMISLSQNKTPSAEQFPSMGCSIKWKDQARH